MIDLHMHSNASDGSDSIPELLAHLQKANIDTFAITDHDTIDGAMEMEAAVSVSRLRPESGDTDSDTHASHPAPVPRYIKGIEFSCLSPLYKCHILGYRYDADDPEFQAAIREGNDLRLAKLEQRISYLRETYQVEFTNEELTWLHSQKSPGKPHLADLLLKRGIGASRDDVIRNCFRGIKTDGTDRISTHTAISGILHAGGIPVWAHPLGGEGEKLLTPEKFEAQLQILIGEGIRALECHYSRYNKEQVQFLRKEAEGYGLLISGGSDYHGVRKTIALGTLNAYNAPVREEELTILREL
ncbi:MAG: PHP domain-containing protein [Lachnospiraceae bacterium]|nr:PHP domain-containing protein [Lachnospiraceae bacterium]